MQGTHSISTELVVLSSVGLGRESLKKVKQLTALVSDVVSTSTIEEDYWKAHRLLVCGTAAFTSALVDGLGNVGNFSRCGEIFATRLEK